MPWEDTEEFIRSGHRSPEEFQQNTLKTVTLSEKEGIQAVIGKPVGKEATEVLSYLFQKAKGWTLEKAKEWFKTHQPNQGSEGFRAVLPFDIRERIADKPLKVRGVALTAGLSRNLNVYTPDELKAFAAKLAGAPMYVEHVAVPYAVGKVTKAEWDGHSLSYEAEVYDEETAEKIRRGLIQHVSVGADYETLEVFSGRIPHGLHNAEISLVAVPGVPEANIRVMEQLRVQNALEPLISGEYILGFQQDLAAFLPEHFTTVWLDRENGVLALMGKPRLQPEAQRTMAIFFSKEKLWDSAKIKDWLAMHPDYMAPVANQSSMSGEPLGGLLAKPAEPVVPLSEAAKLIESILPSPLVQRSWSLGPQRMCQELRRLILQLRSEANPSHSMTGSS